MTVQQLNREDGSYKKGHTAGKENSIYEDKMGCKRGEEEKVIFWE